MGASLPGLALAAAVFGVALWVVTRLLARRRHAEPARLAAASSAGLCALPALGACWLRLALAPGWWLAGVGVLLCAALVLATRRRAAPDPAPRPLRTAALALGGGALAAAGVSALAAAWGAPQVPFDAERAAAVYEMDAAVATVPIPRCRPEPARVVVLLDTGARPRVAPDGRRVWFDAPVDGRRQLHALERATGAVVCWTCREPGNNLRPAPGSHGVVFETDRFATWGDPTNTEIQLLSTRGDEPRWPSRRLSYRAGPDDHALLQGGGSVVWSQRQGGRYQVVTARLRGAHGGLSLGGPALLASGGAAWAAPLAWSPDARSLVVARGNPLRPLPAAGIDFATGAETRLGDAVSGGAAAFNADGGWVVVASARRAHLGGLLPAQLGFLLAPLATALERAAPLYRDTELRVGEPWGEGAPLALGELAGWGAPTGVSLVPGEALIVLGQRRRGEAGVEERLVEIALDCDEADS